ncbi:MAG: hypothetical protein QW666_02890 [Candidatus Woesearchaeota archaeon]
MPDICSDFKMPMQACLCRAENCLNVSLKQTRTKDVLLILLDLLVETFKNGFEELVKGEKFSSDKEMFDSIRKKHGDLFDKHIKTYELLRKMKASKEMKVEEEYRRHVRIIFDNKLTLDIDKGGEYLKEAKEFAQLVLKTIVNTK